MKTLITLLIFLVSVSNVFFQSNKAGATNIIPLAYKNAIGDISFLGPLANGSRTYQLIIHSNLLTDYLGKKITSIAFRLPASAGTNWPTSNVTFSNYKILLSGSVTPANRSLAFFSDNVIGPQTLVRSGSLFVPAGSYPSGNSPNTYGPEIIFDVPYTYSGGNLLVEIRHTGFTGTSQSVDALSSFTGGYNLTYSACWKSSDTATYNAASGNFSIVKLFSAEVVPNDKEYEIGDNQFTGALSFDAKTYQLLIHSNQLTQFIGKKLTAISMRAYSGASSSWPPSDVTFSDYRIYLSGSVDPVNRSLAFFVNNVTGQQRLVRSGPLVIPSGSYSYGNSPNATGPEIIFNSPYIYNGGNLLIEIRHKGFTGTSLSADANILPVSGYGTDFSACYKSTDTATFGALEGSFSTIRISSSEPLELNLKAYIQGRYSSTANMMVPDTSKVLLRHSFSPYAPADTAASLLGSNGIGSFNFSQALQATAYYFVVMHRNSIETWSANTITFVGNDVSISIAANPSQAYGNNLIQVDNGPNAFAVYSADVNQDGTVDLSDGSLIDNDAINFVSGYILTDINGDLIVDVADAVFADNNGFNFVGKITP